MNIFESPSYIHFILTQIQKTDANSKKRGGIKLLADSIGCHPTFISQVIHGKSHLNHDQAILCCKYYQLNEDETDFFIDQLNFERAGNSQAKSYFQRIIQRKLKDRKILYKRINTKNKLLSHQEMLYFSHWAIPVVHAAIQISGFKTIEIICKALAIDKVIILKSLNILKELHLIQEKEEQWTIKNPTLHIPNKSHAVNNFHMQWRLKAAAKLMEKERTIEDIHYSSIFAISSETADKIRGLLLDELQVIREKMTESSAPSRLYAFCLDFFPIL
jgi:uncharacterized protein (TIGR02147 family)